MDARTHAVQSLLINSGDNGRLTSQPVNNERAIPLHLDGATLDDRLGGPNC